MLSLVPALEGVLTLFPVLGLLSEKLPTPGLDDVAPGKKERISPLAPML